MMSLLMSIILLILMLLVGSGFQQLSGILHKHRFEHLGLTTVFVGLGLVLHAMNLIQFMGLSVMMGLVLTPLVLVGVKPLWHGIEQIERSKVLVFIVVWLTLILYLLFFKPHLPVISWDSWLGWELKSKQWLAHGFSVNLLSYEQWLNKDGIYSLTAHYPDGLPLMYYLLSVFGLDSGAVMSYIYILCYYSLTYIVILRIKKQGANVMLLAWTGILFTTLPLLNNHMNLQGYADIWLAMVLLLCVFSLSDWNQNKTAVNAFKLLVLLSMLPLFKSEGWVWLVLLMLAQLVSKFLIQKHRWYLLVGISAIVGLWFLADDWSFSWVARSVVISQSYVKLGAILDFTLIPVDVTREIISGLFLQNNWGLLWYFMPFVLLFWLQVKHPKHQQVTQTFFVLSFVAFLILFFFTDASKWAENYTAVNRIILQLTPVFAYLVVQVFLVWQQKRVGEPTPESS